MLYEQPLEMFVTEVFLHNMMIALLMGTVVFVVLSLSVT